jgi:hypothetical protein
MQPGRKAVEAKIVQTYPFRGSKSRNKVSVGEPAEGSLTIPKHASSNWKVLYWAQGLVYKTKQHEHYD